MDIQARKDVCISMQEGVSKYVTTMKVRPKSFDEVQRRIVAVLEELAAVAVDFQIAVGHIDVDILKLQADLDTVVIRSPGCKKVTPMSLYSQLAAIAGLYYARFV